MIWEADFAKKNFYKVSDFKIKYIRTRQILTWKFYNASDFGMTKNTTRQIFKQKFYNASDFE